MRQGKKLVGRMNDRTRPNLESAEDAYRHLFDAIVDQRLLPGTKLTEMALVEAFGIGRRAIGTALQRLTWERLVVFFPKRGCFVAAPDRQEALEVFAARVALEAGTTEAVAKGGERVAIARLKTNMREELTARKEGRIRDAIRLSGGFHILMAELSGNRILAEQVRLLVARTSLIVNLFDNHSGLAGWHDHHDDLIRLCASGDVDKAVSTMKEHILELREALDLDRRRPVAFDMVGVFSRC